MRKHEHTIPVRTVVAKCHPRGGFAWPIFPIAPLIVRVTFTRAPSTADPVRRARPPRQTPLVSTLAR
jgi:hypothetical protein